MDTVLIIFTFFVGTVVGSFFNVLIPRLDSGEFIWGSSKCLLCKHALSWYELIPLFSYVLQKGRCRNCKREIPLYYFLTELLIGLLFVTAYLVFDTYMELFFAFLTIPFFVAISLYDIRYKLIPNILSYSLMFIALVYLFFVNNPFESILAGIFFALPFLLLYLISGGRWIGFGDVKLALPIGVFVGIGGIYSVFVTSFVLGAIFSVAIVILQSIFAKQKWTLKTEVPFGPFLVVAFFLSVYINFDLIQLIGDILKI